MKTICREVILRLGEQTDLRTLLDLSAKRKPLTEREYVNSYFTFQCFVQSLRANKRCAMGCGAQPFTGDNSSE